ncbi:hypothetical protein C8F04DRAFT_1200229 [Mycena alexandri]|uniref:Uncharacterized protein n=1 Tax=Mycena alexandri TaxID=1745969 RepID=A0AAD6S2C4_9AGAR|nr:hypothetical protein C8F04DRAFT_1200229 [Mycena alexandri]
MALVTAPVILPAFFGPCAAYFHLAVHLALTDAFPAAHHCAWTLTTVANAIMTHLPQPPLRPQLALCPDAPVSGGALLNPETAGHPPFDQTADHKSARKIYLEVYLGPSSQVNPNLPDIDPPSSTISLAYPALPPVQFPEVSGSTSIELFDLVHHMGWVGWTSPPYLDLVESSPLRWGLYLPYVLPSECSYYRKLLRWRGATGDYHKGDLSTGLPQRALPIDIDEYEYSEPIENFLPGAHASTAALNAPVPTMVERVCRRAADGRRTYTETLRVDPPSQPIKCMRMAAITEEQRDDRMDFDDPPLPRFDEFHAVDELTVTISRLAAVDLKNQQRSKGGKSSTSKQAQDTNNIYLRWTT